VSTWQLLHKFKLKLKTNFDLHSVQFAVGLECQRGSFFTNENSNSNPTLSRIPFNLQVLRVGHYCGDAQLKRKLGRRLCIGAGVA
jgi:hypothetical protein